MNKHRKKIKWPQVVRRLVQLLSFILMPGLFISTFTSLKAIYISLINGTFSFSTMMPQILIVAAVIPATIFMGRIFCGFLCSFGSLGDVIWFISKKIRRRPPRISETADRVLKSFKYIYLVFLVVFVWTLGAVSLDGSLDPWTVFGTYATPSGWSSASALWSIGAALLMLIIIGSFFVERFFCRYMCPLGAVFSILSRLRLLKVKKPAGKCGACHVCTFNCPMGIPMYKHDSINSGECIDCFACTSACPRGNTRVSVAGQDAMPLAAGLVTAAAIMGTYFIGRIATENQDYTALSPAASVTVSEGTAHGGYINGTYTGSAEGFKGTTTVQVSVENGYITDINLLSTSDDREFLNLAKNAVISSIIKTQSANVDAVTGATYSSNAIMGAVADALNVTVAAVDTKNTDTLNTAQPENTAPATAPTKQPTAVPVSDGTYADGVYTGVGTGFRGKTKVSVTVSGGLITSIDVVSYKDDRRYFRRAANHIIDSIIGSQSVEVDAVSGATYSSKGIMEAVADALGI